MTFDYILTVLAAGRVTLALAASALLLSIAIGLLCAWAKLSGSRTARLLAGSYTTVIRGIPDLVLMLLVFYSFPALVNLWLEEAGIDYMLELGPFMAGTVTLGLIFGAYMTETFRTALINIPRDQIEAAHAYGMRRLHIFRRIVLPQMIRLALPGFTNNWLVLAKATALVSLIGLQDVMFRAKGAAEATRQPFTFYLVAAGFYLALTVISLLLLHRLRRRYALHTRGAKS